MRYKVDSCNPREPGLTPRPHTAPTQGAGRAIFHPRRRLVPIDSCPSTADSSGRAFGVAKAYRARVFPQPAKRQKPSAKRQKPKAKSQELRAFSLPQVRLFVSQIVVGVAEDHLLVFLIQVAAEFPWGAHPEGVRLHDRLFGNQRAGGDDGAASDDRAVEDDGAHADQAAGFNGAAVQDGVVAHADVVAQVDAVLFFHAVEDTVVLNVGIVADADLVNVAAEDGVHPDAGVFAEDDVADQLGGVVDIAGVGELWGDALVRADHGFIRRCPGLARWKVTIPRQPRRIKEGQLSFDSSQSARRLDPAWRRLRTFPVP